MALSEKQKLALTLLEKDKDVTDLFYGGGAGSGKTFLGCEWQIMRRLLYPNTRGFMGRNTFADFKVTTFKTFMEVWDERWKFNPWGITMKASMHDKIITFSNGSEILIKDLSYNSSDPEFNTLGGMELTDAFIDEVPEITKKAKDVVHSRIRHKLINGKPALLMTGNPTRNWVKAEFVSDEDDKPVKLDSHNYFIPALLRDNPDPVFRANYERQLLTLSIYDRERLLYGNWSAVESIDNPWMYAFRDEFITDKIEFNRQLPYIVSLDFNIDPYCGTVWQQHGKELWCFDEFAIDNGSTPKLCDYLKQNMNEYRHFMRITGDAMGNRRDINQRDHATTYQQIKKELGLRDVDFKIKANPTHSNSREQCNRMFHDGRIKIHPRCKRTIADLKTVASGGGGEIIKSNRNKLEQRADHFDTVRYICSNYG